MEIKVVTGDVAKVKADAIIVGHFDEAKQPESKTAIVDKVLDGAISRLVSQNEMADFVCKHPYWLNIHDVYKNVPDKKPVCK